MAHVEKHAPGSFCWIELGTSDQTAAKTFYTSLFQWQFNEYPMGPGGVYTIFRSQDRDAAAAYALNPAQRAHGVPPHWMIYVSVENADAAAAHAAELGGNLLMPAFDVMDLGRMAVIQDPTGAVFSAWQPKRHQGIGIAGDLGTFCWADLSTPDIPRAKDFYAGLFGWEITPGENKDPNGYLHMKNGAEFIGGVQTAQGRNQQAPPHWLIYFYVADVDASAARAKQLGANLYMPPLTIENVGRMSVMADPQGATFAIFKEVPHQ